MGFRTSDGHTQINKRNVVYWKKRKEIKWLPEICQESAVMIILVGILAFGFFRAQYDGTGRANFNDFLPRNLSIDRIEGGQGLPRKDTIVTTSLAFEGGSRAITYLDHTMEGVLYRDTTRGQQAQYSLAQGEKDIQSYAVAKIIAPAADPSLCAPFEFGVTLLVNGDAKVQSDWFVLSDNNAAIYGSAPIDYAAAKNDGQDVTKYEHYGTWTLEENGNQKTYTLDFDSFSLKMSVDSA